MAQGHTAVTGPPQICTGVCVEQSLSPGLTVGKRCSRVQGVSEDLTLRALSGHEVFSVTPIPSLGCPEDLELNQCINWCCAACPSRTPTARPPHWPTLFLLSKAVASKFPKLRLCPHVTAGHHGASCCSCQEGQRPEWTEQLAGHTQWGPKGHFCWREPEGVLEPLQGTNTIGTVTGQAHKVHGVPQGHLHMEMHWRKFQKAACALCPAPNLPQAGR